MPHNTGGGARVGEEKPTQEQELKFTLIPRENSRASAAMGAAESGGEWRSERLSRC